jgi:hypothetical protein
MLEDFLSYRIDYNSIFQTRGGLAIYFLNESDKSQKWWWSGAV